MDLVDKGDLPDYHEVRAEVKACFGNAGTTTGKHHLFFFLGYSGSKAFERVLEDLKANRFKDVQFTYDDPKLAFLNVL